MWLVLLSLCYTRGMTSHPPWYAVGIMSGTSLDGLDAVVVAGGAGRSDHVVAHRFEPWPDGLRRDLMRLAEGHPAPARAFAVAARRVSEAYAASARAVIAAAGLAPADISVIGMHGQTLFHEPPRHGVTWQVGWPSWVAVATGIPTAGDFRVADVAQGGQGAPLAPLAHQRFFAHAVERRGVLNLGGIANLTVLGPGGTVEAAFDTGPGNMMLDGLVEDATGGAQHYDAEGRLAREGQVDTAIRDRLLAHPFFAQAPPKSTGRETFGRPFRRALAGLPLADALATAVAVTAASVARASAPYRLDRLIVAGGGARNPTLVEAIRGAVSCPVDLADVHGFPAETVEAAAFAWLGYACLQGMSVDLTPVTGGGRAVLGVLARPVPRDADPT
jgi:anhydro-N-acetylmuramic acid kinase